MIYDQSEILLTCVGEWMVCEHPQSLPPRLEYYSSNPDQKLIQAWQHRPGWWPRSVWLTFDPQVTASGLTRLALKRDENYQSLTGWMDVHQRECINQYTGEAVFFFFFSLNDKSSRRILVVLWTLCVPAVAPETSAQTWLSSVRAAWSDNLIIAFVVHNSASSSVWSKSKVLGNTLMGVYWEIR